MASYFPLKTLWRSYFCALVATGVLAVRLYARNLSESFNLIIVTVDESFQNWPVGHVPSSIRPHMALFRAHFLHLYRGFWWLVRCFCDKVELTSAGVSKEISLTVSRC